MAEEGLIQTLVNDGIVTEEDIARALAAQNSMEFVDLGEAHPERRILDMVEADDARRYQALPIALRNGILTMAIGDPMDMQSMDDLTYKLQREIEFVCASPEEIRKLVVKHSDCVKRLKATYHR